MNRIKIGQGTITWDGYERRSDRYGTVALCSTQYKGGDVGSWELDVETIKAHLGTEGVLLAIPTKTRQSDHAGDRRRKIFPSIPVIGEEIPLGQGVLFMEPNHGGWGSESVGVEPTDGRTRDFMNPKALYRVHEQTVELYFIPGGEMPPYEPGASNEGTVTTGSDEDGGFYQIKSSLREPKGRIQPQARKISDELFVMGETWEFVPDSE